MFVCVLLRDVGVCYLMCVVVWCGCSSLIFVLFSFSVWLCLLFAFVVVKCLLVCVVWCMLFGVFVVFDNVL